MKSFATLAIVAAVRLQSEEETEAFPSVAEVWAACDTDKSGSIDFKEAKSCIEEHVPKKFQKLVGNGLLHFAVIPESNWDAVATGIAKYTKVSKADAEKAMEACNTDKDDDLDYKEVKACLKKNADALGLKTKKDWEAAKWGLAQAAVLEKGSIKKAMAAAKKWAKKHSKK